MRILKIWDGDYPWDVRVEKVATALAEAGHTVHQIIPLVNWSTACGKGTDGHQKFPA